MCGIAGFSLSPDSSVDRTLAAQALLAGIAERGADAVGYAHRGHASGQTRVTKLRGGASALLDELDVPAETAPGAHPRARLHEGASRDRGEQPPDPPRERRRHPQRRDRERRRAPRPLWDRARRAADDGRLRGDLRAHGAPATRPPRALRDARRDGGGLARRARRHDALPRARAPSPALARAHCRRPLLRVHSSCADHCRRRA